jgi:tripartite-type tricarboxylate transporter receptor subunit TctC
MTYSQVLSLAITCNAIKSRLPLLGGREHISMSILKRVSSILFCIGSFVIPAIAADSVEPFYRGRQLSIYVGSEAGGIYDLYARLLSRHMGRHIPGNPTILVRNMVGGGGLAMANFLENAGPKDGSIFGIAQSTIAYERLLHLNSDDGKAAQYEAEKLNWIGSAGESRFVVAAWHTAKVKTYDDLLTKELILGTSGQRTDGAIITAALNKLLGTKIRLVPGFQSGPNQMLALERGEIDAAALDYVTITTTRADWVQQGKLNFLIQCALEPFPPLKGVPFALDLVKAPEDREAMALIFSKYAFGRPFVAASAVPHERIDALRLAFDSAMKDPELLSEAAKQTLDVAPMTGARLQSLIEGLYASPPAIQAKARAILALN